jgi:hypothetical protein
MIPGSGRTPVIPRQSRCARLRPVTRYERVRSLMRSRRIQRSFATAARGAVSAAAGERTLHGIAHRVM